MIEKSDHTEKVFISEEYFLARRAGQTTEE